MKLTIFALLLPFTASVPPVARAADTGPETVTLTLPRLNWVLEIGAPGFVTEEKEVADSKEAARFFGSNKKTGVLMSAFLEKADHPGDAGECRAFYWERGKRSPSRKDALSMSESGEMALLEYLVKEEAGIRCDQKNVNAFLSRDGYWADIHLSKTGFKPGDEALFKNVLAAVRIRPKSSLSDAAGPRHYGLPEHGSITLGVPESWRDEVRLPPGDLPPTFAFTPLSGSEFMVLLTPLWHRGREAGFNTPEKIRPLVEGMAKRALRTAVEKEFTLKELRGPSAAGYWYSLTDRAPKPGEWTYLTQGAFGIDDLLADFTILSNTRDSPDAKAALEMLRDMRRCGDPPPPKGGRN